jgi:hypothetical protein
VAVAAPAGAVTVVGWSAGDGYAEAYEPGYDEGE